MTWLLLAAAGLVALLYFPALIWALTIVAVHGPRKLVPPLEEQWTRQDTAWVRDWTEENL